MKKKILFLCTGNTCRSSMAQLLAHNQLKKKGLEGRVEVDSAGTAAFPGQEANPHAVTVMDELGLDLDYHRAKLLDEANLKEASLVVAMTEGHKQQLLALNPEFNGEVVVLGVPDPIGGSIQEYRRCRDYLEREIAKILKDF
ncbi:protein-tyrosine phosphatase [Desulfitispora alkaliphila]|uniref:low molecular weight protein arginine phosphatase n=1 Tax=Desulfitispora alkaliphila TaxID=622674 RepID=UPI003D1F9B5A